MLSWAHTAVLSIRSVHLAGALLERVEWALMDALRREYPGPRASWLPPSRDSPAAGQGAPQARLRTAAQELSPVRDDVCIETVELLQVNERATSESAS